MKPSISLSTLSANVDKPFWLRVKVTNNTCLVGKEFTALVVFPVSNSMSLSFPRYAEFF